MTNRRELAEHLRMFADMGVNGISRDGSWRRRDEPAMAAGVPGAESRPESTIDAAASAHTSPAAALVALRAEIGDCTRCVLHTLGRRQVVFGTGNAEADLMFVGEAPGANEDKQGVPFVGQAGRLLDTLLGEIGLTRGDVFVGNVLKCRPPGNRDPLPQEIDNCQDYLFRQLELIEPKIVCTLGNFATKLLRADTTGITRLHGRPEERLIGPRRVRLYPIYHPAAALYTPAMLDILRTDFHRLPELLELPAPHQPEPEPEPAVEAAPELEPVIPEPDLVYDEQLGLF
jgi:uracil-DNA glycosylase